MAEMTLEQVAEKMRDIDFAILSTRAQDGTVAARPMSNNREVTFDGDSYFFTLDDTRTVADITRDAKVGLAYQAKTGFIAAKPLFITIEGRAELIRDKERFAAHWTKDLDLWFKDGVDTPGLVLVKVVAERLHYWNGFDEGEIALAGRPTNAVKSQPEGPHSVQGAAPFAAG